MKHEDIENSQTYRQNIRNSNKISKILEGEQDEVHSNSQRQKLFLLVVKRNYITPLVGVDWTTKLKTSDGSNYHWYKATDQIISLRNTLVVQHNQV